MKICLVATKDYNFYNFRRTFILTLMKKGNDVILICPYGEKIDFFTDRGCRFIDISIDRRGKNPIKDLSVIKYYKQIFRTEQPDLVLTYTTKCSIYAGIVCSNLNIPYIVNNAGLVKDDFLTNMFLRFLYKKGFKKASCIVCQNKEEKDYLTRILRKNQRFVSVPGSGVDLEEFSFTQYPDRSEPIVFNYVGRIVKLKGIEEFLTCAEAIKEKYQQTRFVIYGEYDDNCYKSRIETLIKKKIVEYGGVLIDMKPAIEKSHAVIHASHYEGMTNVVLEHSSMGRPSIGSNISGIKEAIEDGSTGFLFECGNSASLISAVEKFINLQHEQKEEMGRNARLKMEKEFDRRIVEDIYLKEINRIICCKNE